jgi:APA family basic amino acid/polyamine antiporter
LKASSSSVAPVEVPFFEKIMRLKPVGEYVRTRTLH